MRNSYHFKKDALNALSGNWEKAVLTGFIAMLIGATLTTYSFTSSVDFEYLEEVPLFKVLIIILLIKAIIAIIIGGAGKFGYAKFNMNLIDRNVCEFSDLFSQINRIGAGFCMNFLVGLYTFLWSLLFIIPGVIKSYSYAMTPYIMAENPEMTASEAITESCKIMSGNKWRLFSLQISFIGWDFLCIAPMLVSISSILYGEQTTAVILLLLSVVILIVVQLLLTPYKEAANASFYRDISHTTVSHYIPRELPDSYHC